MASLMLSGCGDGTGSQEPDPVVVDKPIAYVKRPVAETPNTDIRASQTTEAGGDLYLRDRASSSAGEYNLTGGVTGGQGDVRDVSVSFEGDKLLFSLRLPLIDGLDPEDQPTWNIWEYNITEGRLRRIISSDITAEDGHDRFPHYLPDGRIVFSSTRQRQAKARLLDESKPQYLAMAQSVNEPAMVLHVMNDDGSEIEQISFNRVHDFSPSVLSNGQIVFSRWNNADGDNAIHLFRMNPDGTEMELLYGLNSHDTGTGGSTVQFMRPVEMPDGSLLSLLQPFDAADGGGAMVLIDTQTYVDNLQPTWQNNTLSGPAQRAATAHLVTTDGTPSIGGRLSSAFPLYDGTNRMLISWSQCRLMENNVIVPCTETGLADANAVEAPPLYGLFIYDMSQQTQLPIIVPQEGVVYTDVVAADGRTTPPIIYDKDTTGELNATLVAEQVGVMHIRSVYDVDGLDTAVPDIATLADPGQTTAANRMPRFLRLIKPVIIPDQDVLDFDNSAYGVTQAYGMREVIGYTPIEPDGSVQVRVPTNVPVGFEILDADGRKIAQNHPFWLQFRPGEVVSCPGCHDPGSPLPHGRLSGAPPSVNTGAPGGGLLFPNTNPAMWTDLAGDTMAQTRNRLECSAGACKPTMDVLFTDVWTDSNVRALDPDISYRYADLTTANPMSSAACDSDWNNLCRSIIHYEQHIHPLWSVNRQVLDAMNNVIDDHTCIACHTRDNAGVVVVPAGQLELTDGASTNNADHFAAYHELLTQDIALVLDNGALVPQLTPRLDANGNPVYQLDANGNPLLDAMGNPIPVMDQVPVAGGPSMIAGSAAAGRFLGKFDTGGTHEGYLTDAEKRLIAEWLDIGAQYYNNPFDAPPG